MNCPCSGVYVCAYIVIFLPWPAKKSGLVRGSFFLCVLSDSHLSSKAKAQRASAAHNKCRQADKLLCVLDSSVSTSPSASRLANENKISLNNLTRPRLFWRRQTGHRKALQVSGFGVFKTYIIVRAKRNVRKEIKSELKLIRSPSSLFARLWLKCIWAAVA